MDVFVIPVGPDRYELYGEQPEAETVDETPPTGLIGKLRHKVSEAIRLAEEKRHRTHPDDDEPKGFIGRQQDRMMAWVVERIAEQKLLWSLRGQTRATIAHPQDMSFDQVLALVHTTLRDDYQRHRRWLWVDGFLFLVTFIFLSPLFVLIPGVANLPAIYFGFRTLGHFFSMRGAAQGLHHVQWTGRSCPPLGELRDIASLAPEVRHERIHDISARLRLQHLSTFFERVAIHHA